MSCLNLNYFFILKGWFFSTILALMVQRTMQAIHITLRPSLSCDLCLLLFSETIVKWRFILGWTSSKLLVLRPPDLIMQFDWLTLKHLLLKKTSVLWFEISCCRKGPRVVLYTNCLIFVPIWNTRWLPLSRNFYGLFLRWSSIKCMKNSNIVLNKFEIFLMLIRN